MGFKLSLITMFVIVSGCTSENEHFCARYQYVYDQLIDPDLPSYGEMKQQLQLEISQQPDDRDQQRFMLYVLEDFHIEIKPQHLTAREFCMDSKRWEHY